MNTLSEDKAGVQIAPSVDSMMWVDVISLYPSRQLALVQSNTLLYDWVRYTLIGWVCLIGRILSNAARGVIVKWLLSTLLDRWDGRICDIYHVPSSTRGGWLNIGMVYTLTTRYKLGLVVSGLVACLTENGDHYDDGAMRDWTPGCECG